MKQFTCSNSKMPIWVDFVPSCWDMTKVKFIAKVVPGATPKSTIASFWNGDIPFVTPADYVTEDHYVGHWARTITEEGMNSCSTSLLPPNSVIVSNRAPIGLVAINKVPVCTNQGCKGLVIKSQEYSPEYLYRLLSVADDALNALGNGTTYQELSGKALSDFVIPKPPLDVQRSIVAFLDSQCKPLNEAIARHRIIIDKLEDYRKTVITKAVTKGIDENVPLKDSGIEWIGQIPEKWRISRIKFIAKLASGGTPSREHGEYWGGGIPWVKTGELNDGYIENIEESITEEGLMNSSAKVFPKDTLLMAMYGQGKTRGTTGCLTRESAINQACIAFTNLCDVMKDYLWMALRAIYTPIREAAVGSGQPNLSASLIANFSIPIPSYAEQADIATYLNYKCAAIDEGVDRQEQVIARLEEYRRSLIFHAVTGRIDCTGGAR